MGQIFIVAPWISSGGGGGGGGAPSGPAGGVLSGTYPDPGLANNAVTTAKIANANVTLGKLATDAVNAFDAAGAAAAAQSAAAVYTDAGDALALRKDGSVAATGDLSLGSHKLTNLADGTAANDAVNFAQLQSFVFGLDHKPSVVAASTANLNLASMPATVDGVAVPTGRSFLAKDQSAASENGLYVFNGAGVAATRRADADANAEVTLGLAVYVESGTANAGTGWALSTATADPIVVGTTGLTFTQVYGPGSYLNGTGLTLTGRTFAVDSGVVATLTGAQTISNKTLGSDLAAGNHKITGLAAATANGEAIRYEQFTAALISGRAADGSDGALTVGAGTTTVTTDKSLTTLVVQNGGILRGQCRIAASVSITTDVGGTIDRKGGDASGSTGGAVVHTAVSLGIGSAGGNGGTAAGSNGSALSNVAKVANGGAGGAGSGGAGGSGGVGSAPASTQVIYRGMHFREFLATVDVTGAGSFRFNGGAGGGGGGGNGAQAGGGGGAGGSNGVFVTPTFTNNGIVTAAGGNGAAGTASGCGGGGGGTGGVISIMTLVYTNNGTVTVAKGTGGASGGGAGVAGSDGTDGVLLVTPLAA